jgi:hypothetical protein
MLPAKDRHQEFGPLSSAQASSSTVPLPLPVPEFDESAAAQDR